jgi:hypothetical protein
MVSAFVDTAVFIFQVLFVITWVYTRNLLVIDHNFYPLFISLVVLVCFYMGLKFGAYVWKFADIFSTNTERVRRQAAESEQTWTARKLFYNFLELGEYLLYCSFIFVFFVIILYMLNVTDTTEKSLIFQEQTMYQSSTRAVPGLTQECVLPDIYFKENFMNKTMCEEDDGIGEGGKYNPVSMKVFSWTRFLVLQDYVLNGAICGDDKCPPASLLFCANGFEQKWGQCKYGVNASI